MALSARLTSAFDELMDRALREGPQRVRRRQDQVVVLAREEYDRLTGHAAAFKDYLTDGESFDGLDPTRDHRTGRGWGRVMAPARG